MTRSILAKSALLLVLHNAQRRNVWLRPAREPVPFMGAIAGRHPRRPRRYLFYAIRARSLVAQLVLFGTSDAVLSFLRRRVVAVPRPLPNASTALGRALSPRAPGAPTRLFYDRRRNYEWDGEKKDKILMTITRRHLQNSCKRRPGL